MFLICLVYLLLLYYRCCYFLLLLLLLVVLFLHKTKDFWRFLVRTFRRRWFERDEMMFFFEKILLHAIFSILCGKCFILLLQSKRSLLSSLSSSLFSYYKAKSNLFKEDLNSASPAFSTNFSAVLCTCSNVSILLSNSLARKIFSPR